MSRVSINVNGLSLVHRNSGAISTATLPDVCMTSDVGAVPFENVARSRDLIGGSVRVRADGGHSVATAGSAFARSVGAGPSAVGGVVSGTTNGSATWLTHSHDVMIEGRGASRLTDKMLHNDGNTIDCSGAQQDPVPGDSGLVLRHEHPYPEKKVPPGAKPKDRKVRKGFDSNLGDEHRYLNMTTVRAKKFEFVGRYICPDLDGRKELSRKEIGLLRPLKIVAIWEPEKYRAIGAPRDYPDHPDQTGSIDQQRRNGQDDAKKARGKMKRLGAPDDRPIYFTVDFGVSGEDWRREIPDRKTKKPIQFGDLILAYFDGILDILPPSRVGCYGTFVTIKKLFDKGMIHFGWQMTGNKKPTTDPDEIEFNLTGNHVDPRAQIHQTDIYTDPVGYDVTGPGCLDFDTAVWDDYGQW